MALDLDRESYEREVLNSKGPVLVDFWGPQCKPCLALMPAIEQFERDYTGRLKVAKVNASENRMLCAKLRVLGLPSFLLYRDGVEVKRLAGEDITKKDLKEAIEALIELK